MRKIITTVLMAGMLFVSACSMSPAEIALKNKQLDLVAAANARPTLVCTAGCTYNDPNRKLTIPRETNGWDVANTLLKTTANVALTATPWLIVGKIAADGISSAGGNNSNNTHTEANQQNSADQSTVTTNNADGSYNTSTQTAENSYNSHSEANPVTTTTSEDNDTDNSDNSVTTTEDNDTDNSSTSNSASAEDTETADEDGS